MRNRMYGKNEIDQVFRRNLPSCSRADFAFRPDCERHASLMAEADEYRLFRRAAPGQAWQQRVSSQIGRWLVALGGRLESWGTRLAVQAPASRMASR